MKQTKVCIVGAGPAGATAALQLAQLGIECIVVDKAIFPRDKVCGDGLSGKVITVLNRIDAAMAGRLRARQDKLNSWGVLFVSPGRHALQVGYRPDFDSTNSQHKEAPIGYVCKRMDFDNFLVDEMKARPEIQLHEGVTIDKYELQPDGYLISGSNGFQVKAALLIVANGAHASFTKEVANITMEPKHYSAGVRAYYENVTGNNADNFIELHFLKELLPGYFWIFPLPNGQANVGVAVLSDDVRKKKMNLKRSLQEIIESDPILKDRFKDAKRISPVEGYGLPLGTKRRVISGERYMLVGDAAYLIDPFTGEGIGNGMYAGRMAALQAAEAIKANNFSATQLAAYDSEVYRVLGAELKLSKRLLQMVRFPWLVNKVFGICSRNKQLQELVSSMFFEVDIRKKLAQPSFYVKLLLNRPS
ncbi:NAD(P)/FAD-dependent oxidoreductase [Paraflavitalea pollutisoli]|uniref:NAD(P)/FAD-dependent oxidoreductase n=1 Tax=Paraflavitalea pollutisoli TaxID=3034143 RepID=UPI0023ECFE22|nr:geranylgeranyl reductase family protein [Paraflavitalea sp. H1-2-19X]